MTLFAQLVEAKKREIQLSGELNALRSQLTNSDKATRKAFETKLSQVMNAMVEVNVAEAHIKGAAITEAYKALGLMEARNDS